MLMLDPASGSSVPTLDPASGSSVPMLDPASGSSVPMLDPASGSSVTDGYLLAGRFGAAARLSPKALRLYAEQGLLVPARVDPATGYRYYAREQVPLARLIARLRQLGLPVARIGRLVTLSPEAMVLEL